MDVLSDAIVVEAGVVEFDGEVALTVPVVDGVVVAVPVAVATVLSDELSGVVVLVGSSLPSRTTTVAIPFRPSRGAARMNRLGMR